MSGTHRGGVKAAKTIKKRYGDKFYKRIGKKGGGAKHAWRAFEADPELARRAARLRVRRERRLKNMQRMDGYYRNFLF